MEHLKSAAGQTPKALCFAARTDKGVHALENIATCWFPGPFDVQAFLKEAHELETPGLRNIKISPVDPKVHARGNSRGKRYRYEINGPSADTSWQIVPKLDSDAIRQALKYIEGEHDFQSFRVSGCSAATTVKKIFEVKLVEKAFPPLEKGGQGGFHIEIYGNAFLRQMIRILVGTLCEIGAGFRRPEDIRAILEARDRKAAGISAPAHGLTLVTVYFQAF
ncbi:MAG: hypothetical protein JKY15_08105 [Deltaproteobacteria bacterium]|nr:hypothetical protein [Deltaproteobacteria bacterium]